MSELIRQLVKAGALSERIYGRTEEGESDTVAAADAKVDPEAPQVMPGSDAEKRALAAATPSEADDEEVGLEPGEDPVPDVAPQSAAGVDVPVSFLLMNLTAAQGMVSAIEEMTSELSARFGDQAIPVLNDVFFKVRSSYEMLAGLFEASQEADAPEAASGDDPESEGQPG